MLFGFFKSKPKKQKPTKELFAYKDLEVTWVDRPLNAPDLKEHIIFSFYKWSDGTRTCEVDYRGNQVRECDAARMYYGNIIRHWVDAGIYPKDATLVADLKKKPAGEVIKLVIDNPPTSA